MSIKTKLFAAIASEDLRDILFQVSDFSDSEGKKYDMQTLRQLTSKILSRNYDPLIYPLCHLVRASILLDKNSKFEWLFWGITNASSFSIVGHLRKFSEKSTCEKSQLCELNGTKIKVVYGSESYSISHKKLPILIAFMEMILATQGYQKVIELFGPLEDKHLSVKNVREISNRISRELYAYFNDHLLPVQKLRKFKKIIEFFDARYESEFSDAHIDDTNLMAFWTAENTGFNKSVEDFVLFKNVYSEFLVLKKLISEGAVRENFERPEELDLDRSEEHSTLPTSWLEDDFMEEGDDEIKIESFLSNAEDYKPESVLELLQAPPNDAVKFFTKSVLDDLKHPVGDHEFSVGMPLSYLRVKSFSGAQNLMRTISNAEFASEKVHEIMSKYTVDYRSVDHDLTELENKVSDAIMASLYILRNQSQDMEIVDIDLQRQLKKVFGKINRDGFRASEIENEDILLAHRTASNLLPKISETLKKFRAACQSNTRLDDIWTDDYSRFKDVFVSMYGGNNA